MNAKRTLPQLSSLSTAVVAALAAFIAIGLLSAVAWLFQREGAPMEQLAAAERRQLELGATSLLFVNIREQGVAEASLARVQAVRALWEQALRWQAATRCE